MPGYADACGRNALRARGKRDLSTSSDFGENVVYLENDALKQATALIQTRTGSMYSESAWRVRALKG